MGNQCWHSLVATKSCKQNYKIQNSLLVSTDPVLPRKERSSKLALKQMIICLYLAWRRALGKAQMLFSAPATNIENKQAVGRRSRVRASEIIKAGRKQQLLSFIFVNYSEIMRRVLIIGLIREWNELSTYDFKNWSLLLKILEPFNFDSIWWKSF